MKVVCVLLIHGLLVTAFPTNDGVDSGMLMEVPVAGMVEFSGTSPATGSVAIVGLAPYTDILPTSTQNVILGASLADAIMAEAGKDIDAKLAEIDAFVEKELESIAPQIQNALKNAVTSNIDSTLDSTLTEMESKISTELSKFDQFIESELAKTEQLVQTVLRNVESQTESRGNEIDLIVIKELTEQEALMQLVILILQSFVESKLTQTEAAIKSELEKVHIFVETELDKVNTIIESETAKIDSTIETELGKTDALIQTEVTEMESFVESKHEEIDSIVKSESKKVNAFVESELVKTSDLVNSEVSKLETLVETELEKVENSLEEIDDSCPMSSNGPSILPTMEPLPTYLKSYPVLESVDYGDSYAPLSSYIHTGFTPPTVGITNPFIALHPAPYNQDFGCNMQNAEPLLYNRKGLPPVNVIGGTVRATGSIKLFAEFPCPPLTATEVGPDGKKYIWISKKSADKEAAKNAKPKDSSNEESSSCEESSSSEEKSSKQSRSEQLGVDFGIVRPIPVCGNVVFEGTAPAHGSVIITGQTEEKSNCGEKSSIEDGNEELEVDFGTLCPIPVCGNTVFEGTVPARGSVIITGQTEEKSTIEDRNEEVEVDFGTLCPIPVCGTAAFEGAAPAHGFVSITGHSI